MKFTTFMARVGENNRVEIPAEVREKLDLREGDQVELTLKKIKSGRLDLFVSENPLHKLVKLIEEQ